MRLTALVIACFVLCPACATAPTWPRVEILRTVELPTDHNEIRLREPHVTVSEARPSGFVAAAIVSAPSGGSAIPMWVVDDNRQDVKLPANVTIDSSSAAVAVGDPVFAALGNGGVAHVALARADGEANARTVLVFARFDADGTMTRSSVLTGNQTDSHDEQEPRVQSADKPWVAVDRSNGPFRDSIYIAWDEVGSKVRMRMLASRDGGVTFEALAGPGASPQAGTHWVQIAVRPDGTLDAIWIDAGLGAVAHAYSTDGGATFSQPVQIRAIEPFEMGSVKFHLDSLSLAAGDRFLTACGIKTSRDQMQRTMESRKPPRERVWIACCRDGSTWSEPITLEADAADGVRIGEPAVCIIGDRAYMLAYRIDDESTELVLYASIDGLQWRELAVLAQRAFGSDGVRTFGGSAPADVGDYIALAGTGDRLVAAYTLPRIDDPQSPTRIFVTQLRIVDAP